MGEVVKRAAGKRPYDSSGRQAQAARNRRSVIDACYQLLLTEGQHATTLRRVAERAGVSPETVYKTFGSKAVLIKAVYDVTVAGDDQQVPIAARPQVQAIIEAADPGEKVDRYARMAREIAVRTAPLLAALDDEDLTRTADTERRNGIRGFLGHLRDAGALSDDIDFDEAVETVFLLLAPRAYRTLTYEQEWSDDRFEHWLAATLRRLLLAH